MQYGDSGERQDFQCNNINLSYQMESYGLLQWFCFFVIFESLQHLSLFPFVWNRESWTQFSCFDSLTFWIANYWLLMWRDPQLANSAMALIVYFCAFKYYHNYNSVRFINVCSCMYFLHS